METSQLRKRTPVTSLTDPKIAVPAIGSAFAKLDPRLMMKNPVMFVVEVVAALTTVIFIRDWVNGGEHLLFTFQIIVWLWFTVLFANFAEAVAEGRGKAQAATLRQTREETMAKLIVDAKQGLDRADSGSQARAGQIVLVEAGDLIPSDGEVIEGIASVNEAAITGESAPVIREVRRRPLGRHRRHAGGLRLAQGAHHRGARLDLPRPHDCLVEGARAAEDAERDRAEHSARRHDHHLRLRHGDHPELCGLRWRNNLCCSSSCPVRDADPDNDWRSVVCDSSDGEVIEGIASVNEAAITGESAPVIRESGGDRSAVTGGTLVVSDWLKVRITAAQGSTFLDRMIALVKGASDRRRRTRSR